MCRLPLIHLFIFLNICIFKTNAINDIRTTLTELTKEISALQAKKDTKALPPLLWKQDKGLYASHVKLNFHGPPEMAAIRDNFAILDNNMFATAWITSSLVEAEIYGKGFHSNVEQIDSAIKAIGRFRDHNDKNNTARMNFWPQVLNKTTNVWESAPENLLSLFSLTEYMPIKAVEELLKLIGLRDVAKVMDELMREKSMFATAFHIPPDFDDTFVNIGLGSLLAEVADIFPEAHRMWQSENSNIPAAFDALRKYAYRPFSNDSNVNTIDPRTYFYLHEYIDTLNGNDVAFVPTWIQNVDEAMKSSDKGVSMPFFVNNVDITVATNTIYGITASLIFIEKESHFDNDLQKIYSDTVDLIIYEIERNFSARRDLALTYYPSTFECYWFASRILALLRRSFHKITPQLQIMKTVKEKLEVTFKGHVTDDITQAAHRNTEGYVFFDDFLGDGDYDAKNKSLNRAEDRLFTTAMAANTLLNTWTEKNSSTGVVSWVQGTPEDVKNVLAGSIHWLNENILNSDYKPWNAFFSGSGKGTESLPFWYPGNKIELANGTIIHTDVIPHGLFLYAFQGVVSTEVYNKMLQEPHFGKLTPRDFPGFNPRGPSTEFFPFWSSDAYTYATTALALSRYINIA